MKDYVKKQHTGNENGWSEEGTAISDHRMTEEQANELNSQFRNTGTKYEEATAKDKKTTKVDDTLNTEANKAENKKAPAHSDVAGKTANHKGDAAATEKPKRVRPSRAKAKA